MPKIMIKIFKNDTSGGNNRPFFSVVGKDEDGNEYEGGAWYATDDSGERKKNKNGEFYWSGSLKTKDAEKAGKAKASGKKGRAADEDEPF